MAHTSTTTEGFAATPPAVNSVTLDHPWQWLAAGWQDLRQKPQYSLSYGLVFVVLSWLITLSLFSSEMFFLVPTLSAGFFLVAPLLGVAMYQVSRNLERGQAVEFCQVREAWDSNRVHLSAFGLILLMILLSWIMIANIVFALFFTQPIPTWDNFIPVVFLSGNNMGFVFVGTLSGAAIAGFTFAISAITTPLLMDRQIDVMTAMQTSFRAVVKNWQPMLLWGALITMFVGIGIVTFYLGLLVGMPLVGHATWHAYRDLVAPED